jgi:hypothetical protein
MTFDLAAEVKRETDAYRLTRHYRALAHVWDTIPIPSWKRGDELKACRDELRERREAAIDKLKEKA